MPFAHQDLRPLFLLAGWLRQVSGAVIVLNGHASSEGEEYLNANLSSARERAAWGTSASRCSV
jgi:hypothetical protein